MKDNLTEKFATIFGELGGDAATILDFFPAMEWAEEEIERAQRRHKEKGRGKIWNAFHMLTPHLPGMTTDWIFRPHARELLDRIALGQDTRQATDVEIVLNLKEASLVVPPPGHAAGLYFRLFAKLFPTKAAKLFDGTTDLDLESYERIYGSAMDDLYAELRSKLRNDERVPKASDSAEDAA